MNIRSFVGASSAVLLAWLGATFFHEVPPERYPKQDRTPVSASKEDAAGDSIADLGSITH
jgi:hypothetical protein